MSTAQRPIAIDLFAGAGGLSLGFEQAGFDVLAAVEFDPVHCATHKFNFPDCTVFCRSVSDVSGREIRDGSEIGDREVAVLFGGSPCQGYSLIGRRALDDPRNALVMDFVRLVKELRPRFFVFENVPGLTIGKHARFLREIIDEFESIGYKMNMPYRVLHAAEFGVPQSRRRLFLLGARADQALPAYPAPRTRDRTKIGQNPGLFDEPLGPSVWDAIGDLPEPERYPELLHSDCARAACGTPTTFSARMRGLVRDDDDYSHPRVWDPSLLTSSARTVHTRLSQDRFTATIQGDVEPVSRFLRLHPDGLCNTLRAGTGAERGAFTSPRPVHPYAPRCITVREAARLHSYPDWFRFHATKWHGFRQVGNSVPPLLARAVAASIADAMGYHPIQPVILRPLGDPSLLTLDMSAAAKHFSLSGFVLPRRNREAAA